jgi:purine-binding chemotaxis protein CheW
MLAAEQVENSAGKTLMLISFDIAGEGYCLDVMGVREIRGWTPITSMPSAPGHIRGMINLRGSVIPVVDLAVRLGQGRSEGTARTVIIVVEDAGQLTGLLVDAVSEIFTVELKNIQPPPEIAPATRELVQGVITGQGERLLSWLSLEQLVTSCRRTRLRKTQY